jgi:alkylhydroperoxidase family enzyme
MTNQVRVAPVDFDQLSERQQEVRIKIGPFGEDDSTNNMMRTFLNFPEFSRAIGRPGTRANLTSELGRTYAQIAILRMVWLFDCEYLWAHHREAAKALGVSDAQIGDIVKGGVDGSLTGMAQQIVQAVDELHFTHYMSGEKWYRIGTLGHHACTDLFMVYGLYATLSAAVNSMGVQLEAGLDGYGAEIEASRPASSPVQHEAIREVPKRVFEAFYDELTPGQIAQTQRMGRRGKPTTSKLQRAMINYVDFLKHISPFGKRAIDTTSLPPRIWQLACMRTVWLCDSEYLWSQHGKVCMTKLGVSEAVLVGVAEGPDSDALEGDDRAVVKAVDEMYHNNRLSDESWAWLEGLGQEAVTDLLLVYGLYVNQSCLARSFGTDLEDGVPGFQPATEQFRRNQHR